MAAHSWPVETVAARPPQGPKSIRVLAAQAETLDERAVTVDVHVGKVAEQTAALSYQQEQSTTRVVVVLVLLEVFREVLDALAQHGHLHLRGSGVTGLGCVLFDDRLLDIWFECHKLIPFSLVARCWSPD